MNRRQSARVLFMIAVLLSSALAACGAIPPSPVAPRATTSEAVNEHFLRGNELAQEGRFEEAIAEYQAALETDPDSVSAMVNLGIAYYSMGQLDDAIKQYQQALEIAPNDADIHSNLGAAYVQQDNLEEGLQEYQTAVSLDPELAQAYFGLGVIYGGLGQNEDAIAAFEKFQELDEGQDPMATDLAQQYLEQLKGQ